MPAKLEALEANITRVLGQIHGVILEGVVQIWTFKVDCLKRSVALMVSIVLSVNKGGKLFFFELYS